MAKKTPEQLANENKELATKLAAAEAVIKATEAKKVIPVELPTAVAKVFRLVGWQGSHRQHFGKFGIIDLTKLTLAKAQALEARGFQKIQKIKK